MPNAFAYFVLAIAPIVIIVLFRTLKFERALIWSFLVTYLFLPPNTSFSVPMIALDKTTLPNIVILLCCIARLRETGGLLPDSRLARLGLLLFVFGVVGTTFTNLDVFRLPGGIIHGMLPNEAINGVLRQSIAIIPFLLAVRLLGSDLALRELILAVFIGGLVYSIPMLIEVRLSPQLNVWVYGFFQHNFFQMIRGGGFRPIVFLYHGLWVAFFALTALLAAIALARAERDRRGLYLLAALYLTGVLILCRSAGAMAYAIVFAPLLFLLGKRILFTIAAVAAIGVLLYPALRGADLIPVDTILTLAGDVDTERSDSLGYRLNSEAMFLERASERPVFGWGGWGRNFPYNPQTGAPLVAVDGEWIIVISAAGWVGFIGEFGLLALPLLLLWRRSRQMAAAPFVAPIALIVGINMIDLVPNATLTPLTWLMAGALLGYVEARAREGKAAEPAVAAAAPSPVAAVRPRPRPRPERTWI